MRQIRSLEELRTLLGHPSPYTVKKIQPRVNKQAEDFIRKSPLLLLSTIDSTGRPTVSPKGDSPGFVRVENPTTLLIPERKGNRLLMTLQNLLANDHIGLLFAVPGTSETLRVHGTCRLVVDDDLCHSFTSRGSAALLVLRVEVAECFFHCGKALLRGGVWNPDMWPPRVVVSFGEEIAENLKPADKSEFVRNLDCAVEEQYRTNL